MKRPIVAEVPPVPAPVTTQRGTGCVSVEEASIKRAISSVPVVKPIKITAPNSVFALGGSLSK